MYGNKPLLPPPHRWTSLILRVFAQEDITGNPFTNVLPQSPPASPGYFLPSDPSEGLEQAMKFLTLLYANYTTLTTLVGDYWT